MIIPQIEGRQRLIIGLTMTKCIDITVGRGVRGAQCQTLKTPGLSHSSVQHKIIHKAVPPEKRDYAIA